MAQIGTAVLLLVAVLGGGSGISVALVRKLELPLATRVALVPAVGLAFVGLITLVVGHFSGLGYWLPFALAAAGILIAIPALRFVISLTRDATHAIGRHVKAYPIPLIAVSLALIIAAVATVVPPTRQDEVDYHWPAAVEWAAAGGWIDSSFKFVDGFPLMEVIYTSAATQGSYVAAHVMHFIAFLALGFAVAGTATSMGVRGSGVTAAAALAMPVIWDWSYVAYNDVPAGTMGVLAVAVVLGSPARSMHAAWIAGFLVAVGTSIKPTGLAAVGVVGLVVLLRWAFERGEARKAGRAAETSFGRVFLTWLAVGIPGFVALVFWSARQYLITGSVINPALADAPSADALSRLPNAVQQLLAPLLPLVSGIVGSSEPWGGRTSLVLQLFLIPAIIYVLVRRGSVLRRFALMAVPAWAHWIVLGLRVVRTRFHDITWTMLVVAVRIAMEDFASRHPRWRPWLEAAWTAGILLGLADVTFEMVRHLAKLL